MTDESAGNPVIMVVYGTRPEAIKLAPVIREIQQSPDLTVHTVVTGQHREMLDQVNELFGVEPDTDLDVMTHGQTLNNLVARVTHNIDPIYERIAPAAVLVQGDTTTVLAAAIAAFNRGIPVIHLEAGLRSGNMSSPYPEEGNRKLVAQIAALHLAPTSTSRDNLLREGIEESSVVVTGNTVIDALHWAVQRPQTFTNPALQKLDSDSRVLLLTTHRRENLGKNMENIGRAIRTIAVRYPDVTIVWPAHKNVNTRMAISKSVEGLPNVLQVEPLGYADFAHLMARSYLVVSDSGGVQEEAPSLGKPVLVLRENTERPEAVYAGTVAVVGTESDGIIGTITRLLDIPEEYAKMANAVNPYGDGAAATRVVNAIKRKTLGLGTSVTSKDAWP